MRRSPDRSFRPVANVVTVVLLLAASVFTSAGGSQPAAAQDRPPCSDGPGNAWDQVRGEMLDAILPDWVSHPYGPESIDDAAERCLQFAGPNRRVPGLPGGPGTNRGDPHIVTQDGLAYDFHGAGDFVLLGSPANDVEMQVRYRRSKFVSLFAAVAIRDGDSTLTIENFVRGEAPVVTLDGEPLVLGEIGWYDLEIGFVMRTGTTIYAELANGVRIEAKRAGLTLLTPAAWAGEFEGIQGDGDGDPTNDIATREGTPINATDIDALYGEFFDSWYVDPADSMFTMPFDEAADGPIRPEQVVTLADLRADDVTAAEQVCTESGLVAGAGLEDCTFDVAVTGDSFWAENVAAARLPSIPAVSLDPTVENSIVLAAIDTVAPNRPEPGAGVIEQRYAVDDYAVAAAGDGVRLLRASEPCAAGIGPVAVVILDDTLIETLSLTCGAVHAVPSEAFTLRVIDPNGGTPSYGFGIAPAGVVELGMLTEDEELSGELGEGDRAIGELALGSGSRVFVTALGDADCGPLVSIRDVTGELQAPARAACVDIGPVELAGAAPFTIEISGKSAGTYHFAVSEVAGDTVTATDLGQSMELGVSSPGQRASATIELAAGQRVYIETVESIDGHLVVAGPDGVELSSTFSFRDPGLIAVSATGIYTITIEPDDATTGTQRLVVHEVADDTTTTARFGQEVELMVSTPGQQASAVIDLVEGDRVYVETIESMDGELVVAGPDGVELSSTFSFRDAGLIAATATGAYTVTIDAEDAITGTQQLSVHRVSPDTTSEIEVGSEVSLVVSTPGQRASASIELAAGEQVYVETIDWIDGRLVVVDPAGIEVGSRSASQELGLVDATSAGTHYITIVPKEATTGTHVLLIRRP